MASISSVFKLQFIQLKEACISLSILCGAQVTELECREYIQALQREAERALYEHVRTVHRGSRLRAVLNTLRATDPDAVAALFFRPVTGTSSTDEHVLACFMSGGGTESLIQCIY